MDHRAACSVSCGWYCVSPASSLHVDSILLVTLPAKIAALASQRGDLLVHLPLCKRIDAVVPQQPCIAQQNVCIEGVPVVAFLPTDTQCRKLAAWPLYRPLRESEMFLLSTLQLAPFDRCCASVPVTSVLRTAPPIWTGRSPWVCSTFTALRASLRAIALHMVCIEPYGEDAASVQYNITLLSLSTASTQKTMQGKIKGRGTKVRAKPCLHRVWRGTRGSVVRAAERCHTHATCSG
jgi:type IV secretory pathway protease TraF